MGPLLGQEREQKTSRKVTRGGERKSHRVGLHKKLHEEGGNAKRKKNKKTKQERQTHLQKITPKNQQKRMGRRKERPSLWERARRRTTKESDKLGISGKKKGKRGVGFLLET